MKSEYRSLAISLRLKGYSYREIREMVPVSIASLSLWLRDITLTNEQQNRILQKKLSGAKAGALSRHRKQVGDKAVIVNNAQKEIGSINRRDLWLLGIGLYWAEGSKQKTNNPSQGVVFSNGDHQMIKVFLEWLKISLNINTNDLIFEIYLHIDQRKTNDQVQKYWANTLSIPDIESIKIYYKKNQYTKVKYNENYKGVLRIKVRRSTTLNRKIEGWIKGIYCGIV